MVAMLPFFAAPGLFFAQEATGQQSSRIKERVQRFKSKGLDDLIADLRKSPDRPGVIHRLRTLGDKKAIPALKEAFEAAKVETARKAAAAALVSLGAKEGQYWEFLAKPASEAVESDMPMPIFLDSDGKPVKGKMSPEFLEWAKAHNQDPRVLAGKALYGFPSDILFLGLANDKRAVPIFRKGLDSPNYMVASRSAQGLAGLGEAGAVEAILGACNSHPKAAAGIIAESLAFFEDKPAHQAAKKYVSKEKWDWLRGVAEKKGRLGVFQTD